jgi:hypothetical protein
MSRAQKILDMALALNKSTKLHSNEENVMNNKKRDLSTPVDSVSPEPLKPNNRSPEKIKIQENILLNDIQILILQEISAGPPTDSSQFYDYHDEHTEESQIIDFDMTLPTAINNSEEIELSYPNSIQCTISTSDNDIENNPNNGEHTNTQIEVKQKRKKLHIKNNSSCLANKKRRELGLSYEGKKKLNDGTWDYKINKSGKFLIDPCSCKLGTSNTALQCQKLTENQRHQLFQLFWKKTWPEKREYIRGLAKIDTVSRRRGSNDISRREFSVKYHLKFDMTMYRVCKKMFIGTLGTNQNSVLNWIKKDLAFPDTEESNDTNIKLSPSQARQQFFKEKNDKLQAFLQSLPKMESHYCRTSSERLYLEPIWQSKRALYNFYSQNFCISECVKPVSSTKFNESLENEKISLYRPKKDECDTCASYKLKNITDNDYTNHVNLKEEARCEKSNDKVSELLDFVFTMDLQSAFGSKV